VRIPPNFFGIAFGLTGLSAAWGMARAILGMPMIVPGAIAVLAAGVWLTVAGCYLAQGRARIMAGLRDPVLSPFVSGGLIAPMILGAELAAVAPTAGRVVVVVFLALTVAVGGWFTGQWMLGHVPASAYHPGYFLPTVMGGLVGAYATAAVHLHALAMALFGIGIICWLLLGSTMLSRLFFQPLPPTAPVPTLAIEVAPAAAAGIAWFAMDQGRVDFAACALGGYAVLMALAQLRFIPVYRKLRYTPAFWLFVFSYSAAATDAAAWLRHAKPAGAAGWAITLLVLITILAAAIAARTVVAMVKGQFLAAPAPDADPRPVTAGASS
jgi:tellurite resistance protein